MASHSSKNSLRGPSLSAFRALAALSDTLRGVSMVGNIVAS